MEHPLRPLLSGPVVGLLVSKNEADILPRALRSMGPYCDAIYALIGDDESAEFVKQYGSDHNVRLCLRDSDVEAAPFKDYHRQALLMAAQSDYPPNGEGNGWFLILHGDEIWFDDPIACALMAERLPQRSGEPGWDTVTCDMAQSYLSLTAGDWVDFPACKEQRMFRNVTGIGYPYGQNYKTTPEGISGKSFTDYRPVIRHFTYRNPDQAWRMAWESYTLRRARQSSHDWILERRTAYTVESPSSGLPLREWQSVAEESQLIAERRMKPRVRPWWHMIRRPEGD